MEVITSVRRYRYWTLEEKTGWLHHATDPSINASLAAREVDAKPNQFSFSESICICTIWRMHYLLCSLLGWSCSLNKENPLACIVRKKLKLFMCDHIKFGREIILIVEQNQIPSRFSTFHNVQGKSSSSGFLVFCFHIFARFAHGLDDFVQTNTMLTIAA